MLVYNEISVSYCSPPAIERLSSGLFQEVIITNTIPLSEHKYFPQLTVLSVANLLGETIWRVHDDYAVSTFLSNNGSRTYSIFTNSHLSMLLGFLSDFTVHYNYLFLTLIVEVCFLLIILLLPYFHDQCLHSSVERLKVML